MNIKREGEQRLIVVLGPTASGKSALGISLAKALAGEVVVCDSTQVYRHFDIGTAKVAVADQQGVPHHLIDLVEPYEVFTAGEYRRRALKVLAELKLEGRLPVMTAGTGLYLRALLEGLAEAPERSEPLRERLRKVAAGRGPDYLHRVLKRLDAEAADKIAPRDTQKVIRAIEIRTVAQKSVGEVHRSGREPLEGYRVIKIGLAPPRAKLYARINGRTEAMIGTGWVEEVRRLIGAGIGADAKPFSFIGYRELRTYLGRRISLEEAILRIQQATRNFAKRQMTWFRREPDVLWLEHFGDEPAAFTQALAAIRSLACRPGPRVC